MHVIHADWSRGRSINGPGNRQLAHRRHRLRPHDHRCRHSARRRLFIEAPGAAIRRRCPCTFARLRYPRIRGRSSTASGAQGDQPAGGRPCHLWTGSRNRPHRGCSSMARPGRCSLATAGDKERIGGATTGTSLTYVNFPTRERRPVGADREHARPRGPMPAPRGGFDGAARRQGAHRHGRGGRSRHRAARRRTALHSSGGAP